MLVDDQFDGTRLNPALWEAVTTTAPRRDGELQAYSPSQVSVGGGMLELTAEKVDGRWVSGEVVSRWTITYGVYSMRLRVLGLGAGYWPAAWWYGTVGQSPADGEIDGVEEIDGHRWDLFTVHGSGPQGAWQESHWVTLNLADWHTYTVTKTPTAISLSIDGHHVATVTDRNLPKHGVWPYNDRPFEAVLNVAVGGNWPGPPNARTPAKAVMQVDWYTVRAIGAT